MWHEGFVFKLRSVGISGELYNLLGNFFSDRFQSVILNGQESSWRPVKAGVPQGSILGPLLFLVYINDLPNELKSSVKLFADDTSLFTIVKQHIDSTIFEINKGISVIKKLRHSLPRKSLMTIYKAFLRPLIDYGDIIYDQPQNESFCEKLESVQYKAALAITGAIQGTSREKIYQELGLESLKSRRWYKRLSCMFKIMKEEVPNYLINSVPKWGKNTRTRNKVYPL